MNRAKVGVSDQDISGYLENVQAEYPTEQGNHHDILVNFFARAIARVHSFVGSAEEVTFQRVFNVLEGSETIIEPPREIAEVVLCDWPEICQDEEAKKVIEGGCGRSRVDMYDLTIAWKASPFSRLEATAV